MPLSMLPEDLTDAEKELVEKVKKGEPWIRTTKEDGFDDPANGASWGLERTIRAEVIYALAVGDNPEVHAKGVQILGAKIDGPLDLEGARIPHPLVLAWCFIGEPITLRDADALSVSLVGSRVAGIEADRLRARGSVLLRQGFHGTGEVQLVGAKIGGNLECSGGTFENADGIALYADGATVDGDVFLGTMPQAQGGLRFNATGEVRLLGARIGGNLDCSGGNFKNALSADGANVDAGVFLREGFHATGEVRLLGAAIGGDLDCSGGTFENAKGIALNADGATVDGSVFLREGFHATGEVNLVGAKIGGQLNCGGGTFENANGITLNLDRATVTATFFLRKLASPPAGIVNLGYAQVGELNDDEESWPNSGKLYLDGFVYSRLAGPATPWRAHDRKDEKGVLWKGRLYWLSLQPKFRPKPYEHEPDFRPQPYEQLIRVLREMGHEREAREVAIAKQVRVRKYGGLGFWSRARNLIFGFIAAHGYKGERAFGLLFAVWVVGTAMFCAAERKGVMVPSKEKAYVSYQSPLQSLPPGYPVFHAPLYAIDTLLPGIDLHQKSKWYLREKNRADFTYWAFETGGFIYFVICWVLTLIGVGAVSGLVRPK